MKKYSAFIYLTAFLLPSSDVCAEPYQKAVDDQAYICFDAMDAVRSSEQNYASPGMAAPLLRSGACREQPKDAKLRVIEKKATKDYYYYQVEIIGEPKSERPQFISSPIGEPQDPEAVLAARKAELAKIPEGCVTPTGGQINRLERGKDGQIFLKRYMVTSKCVNGQMRSFTTPLD